LVENDVLGLTLVSFCCEMLFELLSMSDSLVQMTSFLCMFCAVLLLQWLLLLLLLLLLLPVM